MPQWAEEDDSNLIQDFRRLVWSRFGQLGLAILDAGLQGQETKSLVGRPDLGTPGTFVIKRVVGEIKTLARQFAQSLGDPAFYPRDVRAGDGKGRQTVAKRRAPMAMP